MAQDLSYERLGSDVTNTTPISISPKAAEIGGTEAAVDAAGQAGDTAGIQATLTADADESGGADIQDLWRIVAKPLIDATAQSHGESRGTMTLEVTITPVKGDGTAGTAQKFIVTHPENIDAWQTAAGRARQPIV